MDTYDTTQAQRFRAALEQRAVELRAILSHEADAAHDDAPHEPDGFVDEAERIAQAQVDDSQAARAAAELLEIDAALRRIAQGSYGRCADCGAASDLRRLATGPATAHCASCQSDLERG